MMNFFKIKFVSYINKFPTSTLKIEKLKKLFLNFRGRKFRYKKLKTHF